MISGDFSGSVGYPSCCLCFNSLEMKQHSDYKYLATAPSKGPAIISSILHPSHNPFSRSYK
jgi:hypothetical protein